jgi:hypothetical protein
MASPAHHGHPLLFLLLFPVVLLLLLLLLLLTLIVLLLLLLPMLYLPFPHTLGGKCRGYTSHLQTCNKHTDHKARVASTRASDLNSPAYHHPLCLENIQPASYLHMFYTIAMSQTWLKFVAFITSKTSVVHVGAHAQLPFLFFGQTF